MTISWDKRIFLPVASVGASTIDTRVNKEATPVTVQCTCAWCGDTGGRNHLLRVAEETFTEGIPDELGLEGLTGILPAGRSGIWSGQNCMFDDINRSICFLKSVWTIPTRAFYERALTSSKRTFMPKPTNPKLTGLVFPRQAPNQYSSPLLAWKRQLNLNTPKTLYFLFSLLGLLKACASVSPESSLSLGQQPLSSPLCEASVLSFCFRLFCKSAMKSMLCFRLWILS